MAQPIRKANFIAEWIDMKPSVPVPRIDWIKDKRLDIAYGMDAKQKYDLYMPNERNEKLPIVIIIHGGGFSLMDKRDWHLYPGFFALCKGFAVASVNYRLAPKNPYPAAVKDIAAAVAHIRKNAGLYGINADKVFLYGTSAGGSLAVTEALTNRDGICGVALLCPVISCNWIINEIKDNPSLFMRVILRRMFRQYFGVPIKSSADLAHKASAENFDLSNVPPFYIQQGTKDPLIPPGHAARFQGLLLSAGTKAEDIVLHMMDGAVHAGGGPDYLEEHNILPIIEFFKRYC